MVAVAVAAGIYAAVARIWRVRYEHDEWGWPVLLTELFYLVHVLIAGLIITIARFCRNLGATGRART
jgi:hypothetical protein